MPPVAMRQGAKDTLLSAEWFEDRSRPEHASEPEKVGTLALAVGIAGGATALLFAAVVLFAALS